MIKRRDFMKGMIGVGLLGILPAPFLSDRPFNDRDRIQTPMSAECGQVPKGRRIYYLADNIYLYVQIHRSILSLECEIFSLSPYSADGSSLSGFVYIIDRIFVGKEWWNHHIRCCDKYGWREPCLLIDTTKDTDMPKSTYAEQFDVNDPSSISSMIYIIKEARIHNILRNHCNHNRI
jgi:hypothetical protein